MTQWPSPPAGSCSDFGRSSYANDGLVYDVTAKWTPAPRRRPRPSPNAASRRADAPPAHAGADCDAYVERAPVRRCRRPLRERLDRPRVVRRPRGDARRRRPRRGSNAAARRARGVAALSCAGAAWHGRASRASDLRPESARTKAARQGADADGWRRWWPLVTATARTAASPSTSSSTWLARADALAVVAVAGKPPHRQVVPAQPPRRRARGPRLRRGRHRAGVHARHLGVDARLPRGAGDGAADGPPVLVLDTEGIDALDAGSDHDVRIFALAILLCSAFVYNSTSHLDEAAMQTLSLMSRVAEALARRRRGRRRAAAAPAALLLGAARLQPAARRRRRPAARAPGLPRAGPRRRRRRQVRHARRHPRPLPRAPPRHPAAPRPRRVGAEPRAERAAPASTPSSTLLGTLPPPPARARRAGGRRRRAPHRRDLRGARARPRRARQRGRGAAHRGLVDAHRALAARRGGAAARAAAVARLDASECAAGPRRPSRRGRPRRPRRRSAPRATCCRPAGDVGGASLRASRRPRRGRAPRPRAPLAGLAALEDPRGAGALRGGRRVRT